MFAVLSVNKQTFAVKPRIMLRMLGPVDPRVRVAVCLPREGEILLVEHCKGDRRYWLLPGGGVERGETLLEAARREFEEETGIDVEVGRLLLICESIAPGGRHVVHLVFRGRRRGGDLRRPEDGAVTDVRWHARDQLSRIELHPPIAAVIEACWNEAFEGDVRVLGNVWEENPGH